MWNRKRIIAAAVVAVAAAGGLLAAVQGRQRRAAAAAAEQTARVETVRVERQNLIDSISVTGTIKSADAWDVSASAKDVKVLEVNCEVGDYVQAGDVIVVLDTSDLELKLQEARNRQALSAYNENKSIETAAENYTEAVEDGTDEYNKAVRNESEAKEALQEAEGDLSDAAERLKRREERLGEAKAALDAAAEPTAPEGGEADPAYAAYQEEQKAYQELQKAYQEAQSSYTEAHQAYNAAKETEERALDTYENASEALADAGKKNDRNVSSAEDNLEKAQMEHAYSNDSSQQTIENYEEQIASCTVTAPISGVITAVPVQAGDTYMGEGSTLFSVADREHFVVAASVDEYDISSIGKDMTAAVIVEAIGEEELPAKVSFVSPTVTSSNMGSSSYDIEIALDDANTDLRIGMTAKASIVLDAAYDVLTVPYDCVETDEEGNSSVWIDQGGERVSVPVTVGMQGDYYVEISSDAVTEGTQVYYPSPMLAADGSGDEEDAGAEPGFPMGGGMPGGGAGAPSGGPGGGGPGGGRGGF